MNEPHGKGAASGREALRCLYCGRERPPGSSACAGCGAETPTVPCVGCGRPVTAPQARCVCGAVCGAWAGAAPHELPCPRCGGSIERVELDVATVHVEQCARCHGCFLRTEDYSELVGREEAGQSVGLRRFVPLPPGRELPRQTLLGPVRCPHCAKEMDRVRFAQRASVIVDVCPPHGIWFDAGELVAVVNLVRQRKEGDVGPGAAERAEAEQWARVEALHVAEHAHVEAHLRNSYGGGSMVPAVVATAIAGPWVGLFVALRGARRL